jgi:glyoxylase-like metal-dependent hydrolase (beta-lactamase superfamily II)
VRAVALHADVILTTSAVLQANCVILRGRGAQPEPAPGPLRVIEPSDGPGDETLVIDSPVLPEELSALGALVEQARFPPPSGLLATHGDWDHLLGRLAFPDLPLGCAQDTAERLQASPGRAQRELRSFDEELMIDRERPLALGAVQALPVPGRCDLGSRELELHPAPGHTRDGMAVMAGWAGVLVAGDYLSEAEIPSLGDGGDAEEYMLTLERLRALVARARHVVPGHGPVLDSEGALRVLEEDLAYMRSLRERGTAAELPVGRRSAAQRRLHAANAAAL